MSRLVMAVACAGVVALLASEARATECGGVPVAGCCDGGTFEYCRSDGTLAKVSCGSADACVWEYGNPGHYACVNFSMEGVYTDHDPTGTLPKACPAPAGQCIPDCTGKECGDDGCGGTCGTCGTTYCEDTSAGLRQNTGTCAGTSSFCSNSSWPPASGCCDGPVYKTCDPSQGVVAFSCDEFGSDLRCGVPDGTLKYGSLDVGCVKAATAQPLPDCAGGCQRRCDGKTCGDDGCGGSCGACPSGEECNAGQCATPSCSPACARGQTCTFSGCEWPSCTAPITETSSEFRTGSVEVWGPTVGDYSASRNNGLHTYPNNLDQLPSLTQGAKAIVMGSLHAAIIDPGGVLHEFGEPYGCGIDWRVVPADVASQPFSAVAADGCNFIGVYGTGKVVVWGADGAAQQYADGITDAVQVAAGGTSFLVLHADGTVSEFTSPDTAADVGYFWYKYEGTPVADALWDDAHAAIGAGVGGPWVSNVAALPGISGATAISAHGGHYVAINGDGTVVDWGDGWLYDTPEPNDLKNNVAQLAAGDGYSLALLKSGALRIWADFSWTWPANPDGRDQNLNGVVANLPTTHDFVAVATGSSPGALRADGSIVMWDATGRLAQPADLGFVTAFATTFDYEQAVQVNGHLELAPIAIASTKCAVQCTPSCTANTCETDGCGGICPNCGGCDPTDASCSCVPQCHGRQCGPDECGGSCGTCAAGSVCTSTTGQCACVPDCAGKTCGPNGCGGSCGSCGPPDSCQPDGTCACVPKCDGKSCGDDGCGGSCGSCAAGTRCSAEGTCDCVPKCDGKSCGDDGCGGSCGYCGAGKQCSASGQCECAPSCATTVCDSHGCTSTPKVCGSDGCGGSCGACPSGESCTDDGYRCGCVPSCDGRECGDDGCGGSCGFPACPTGEACSADGHCECDPTKVAPGPCLPMPDGIQACGTDSCGTSCGSCPGGEVCRVGTGDTEGVCVCAPQCDGRECGPDGCGGACGVDRFGSCAATHGRAWSCNVAGQCQCTPNCDGRQCGSDGCGGSCGKCGDHQACSDDVPGDPLKGFGRCEKVADCAGKVCGPDGIGGTCGSCPNGGVCNTDTGQCIADPCTNLPAGNCCAGTSLVECDTEAHRLEVAQCGANHWACGWVAASGDYDCGGGGAVDPSGAKPIACPADLCIPQCHGKSCGPDGCGGSCGSCGSSQICDDGVCGTPCQPQCSGKSCGPDGCGGTCGACPSGESCAGGACCTPQCDGRSCGPDGCGGTCGSCDEGHTCDANGQCQLDPCNGFTRGAVGCCSPDNTAIWCDASTNRLQKLQCGSGSNCGWDRIHHRYDCFDGTFSPDPSGANPYLCPADTCVPQCDGRNCGDDGCGGTCGTCPGGQTCSPSGLCYTACTPHCDGTHCGEGSWDGCGHECGCGDGEACKPTAERDQYGAYTVGICGAPCDGQAPIGVGCCANYSNVRAYDPTFDGPNRDVWSCPGTDSSSYEDIQVTQCPADELCGWSSRAGKFTCGGTDTPPANVTEACPNVCSCKSLDGNSTYQCGDDGCGGSCGSCPSGETCQEHSCQVCTPKCSADYVCGDDGCGGTCGACPGEATCDGSGRCQLPASCGSVTAAGTCDGDTAKWCTDYGVQSTDCTTLGEHCSNGACVAGQAGSTAHSCSADDCGQKNASWSCQCDAACADRHDCCGDYDEECGAATSLGTCGDGTCEAGSGEDCLTCPDDCHGCASIPASQAAVVAPYPEVLRDQTLAGQSASFEVVPVDDVRPSGPPWSRQGLVAYLPEPGVNAGSPHALVSDEGAVGSSGRTKKGEVLTVADGVQGKAFSFNDTASFHDPGLCGSRRCGSDGAGGSCGTCPSGTQCDEFRGDCYDPNRCIESSIPNPDASGNDCLFYGDDGQCGSDGCGHACGGGDGSCANGDYCSAGSAQCFPKANIDKLDLCAGRECGPTSFSNLSCGTCSDGKVCRSDGHCHDDVSSDGVVRIVPPAQAPRDGSSADHTEGGATLAFWFRVPPGSLKSPNPLAATRTFGSGGGEVCGWTRPGDTKVQLSCPGFGSIVAVDAYWGSVDSAPWPDGSCDSFRRIHETGECSAPSAVTDAQKCVGLPSCTLDYRNVADPCASQGAGSVLALRVVCDSDHTASSTLYVGDESEGNHLVLSVPGQPDLVSRAAVTAGTWTHVALSHERIAHGLGDVSLYVNGELDQSTHDYAFPNAYEWDLGAGFLPGAPGVPNAINGNAAIRDFTTGAFLSFTAPFDVAGSGDFDDVFLYDRSLSAHEIEALHRQPDVGALRVWPAIDPSRAVVESSWAGPHASPVPVAAKALLDPARSTASNPVPFADDEKALGLPAGTNFTEADAAPDLGSLSTFTLAGWVRPSTLAAGTRILELTQGTTSELALTEASACSGGALTASLGGGAALTADTTCAHGLAANDWAFVAYVQDGQKQSVYVDGVLTASGTSPAPIFTGTGGDPRALHSGDGVDLSWAALYTTAYTPDELENLRSQGPAVWIEGGLKVDLAAFHNDASGVAKDAAVLWSGANGLTTANSGAKVTVPARGRFRTLKGGERAFSWSGRVTMPANFARSGLTVPLFELDQPGSKVADASLVCGAQATDGTVACHLLVDGIGADGKFDHWATDNRVAPGAAFGNGTTVNVAIAFDEGVAAAMYLEAGDGGELPFAARAGTALTVGEVGTAGAAPSSTATAEQFVLPSSSPGSTGATWSDLRLYARVLSAAELGAIVKRGCGGQDCGSQERVCVKPQPLAGAASRTVDLSTCGGCADGTIEHSGECIPKQQFAETCATDVECANGPCGPAGTCIERTRDDACENTCLDEGRDCVLDELSGGYTCSATCHPPTSARCQQAATNCRTIAGGDADDYASCYAAYGCHSDFQTVNGQCRWGWSAQPGDACADDYDCSSAKCVTTTSESYEVNDQHPWQLSYGSEFFPDSDDPNACLATEDQGKGGECAEPSTTDVTTVSACAGFDDLVCKNQHRTAVPQTTVVPGKGSTTVYSCGKCQDGYHSEWTLLSPEACQTMWENYYALGDDQNQNYQGKHELEAEPNVTTLRRLLLKDSNPTSNPTPKMFADMEKAGAGAALLNWASIAKTPAADVYRDDSYSSVKHFWMSDCNKNPYFYLKDPSIAATDANPLGVGVHANAFANPELNHEVCVADRQPNGSQCPKSGVTLDRAHAGENCDSGFCAADTKLCEDGVGPTFEETQGAARNDQNQGNSPDNDIGGIALTQQSYSYVRVSPSTDPTVTDKRTYGMGAQLSYTADVFGLLEYDVLDVNVALATEKEKKTGTYDQSVEVFGLDVPVPPPDRPDAVAAVTHQLAGCSGPEWKDGEFAKPDCQVAKDDDGQPKVTDIDPVELDIPLPVGDCEEWGKGSAAVATSGVIEKGPLCFKETTLVGFVPITVKAEITLDAELSFGAVVDPDEMSPAFVVTPGIGMGLDVHGGVGIEEFVTAYAGVHANIGIITLSFPVEWALTTDQLSDASSHLVDGLYAVNYKRNVYLQLNFLKMSLGVFIEMGIGPFTHEWDWDLLGFDGITLTWTLDSKALNTTKVDFQWQP